MPADARYLLGVSYPSSECRHVLRLASSSYHVLPQHVQKTCHHAVCSQPVLDVYSLVVYVHSLFFEVHSLFFKSLACLFLSIACFVVTDSTDALFKQQQVLLHRRSSSGRRQPRPKKLSPSRTTLLGRRRTKTRARRGLSPPSKPSSARPHCKGHFELVRQM